MATITRSTEQNEVLESCRRVAARSEHVRINESKLDELVEIYSKEQLTLPRWQDPVFIKGAGMELADFLFLGNAINFGYIHHDTGQKYTKNYAGIDWAGAFGMWASLKGAFERDNPFIEPIVMADITAKDLAEIFDGRIPMPMLEERARILREIGCAMLDRDYIGFEDFITDHGERIFGQSGLLNQLVEVFPAAFGDSQQYRGSIVVFNKKAQLAIAMWYERNLAEGQGLFTESDIAGLTVFADYELPRALRLRRVLEYTEPLAKAIDSGIPLGKDSEEEVELRANTVWAAELLRRGISKNGADGVTALHLDYRLWQDGRKDRTSRPHLTMGTTSY